MHHLRMPGRHAGALVATVLLLVALASSGSASADDLTSTASATPPVLQNDCGVGGDAGASHAVASSLAIPKANCTGDLFTALDPQDWYRFSVNAGEVITATMTPTAGSDFNLCLYNPSGSSVACSANAGSATESLSYTASVTGSWRLAIVIVSAPGDRYTMSVWAMTPQNDCGTGGNAGDSQSAAALVTLPKDSCTGQLVAVSDTEDWYQFAVTTGHLIGIDVTSGVGAFEICLHNPAGVQVGSCSTSTIRQTATVPGNWRLRVRIVTGSGYYSLTMWTLAPQNDCGTGGDASNNQSTPSTVTLPKNGCTAALASVADTNDWYQFAVTNGQTIHAFMTPNASADFDVCLYDPNGSPAGNCAARGTGATDLITFTATSTGNWRLRVFIDSGQGSYTLTLSTTTPNNDCGTGVEAGDDSAAATALIVPKTDCVGYLMPFWIDDDWYQFHASTGQTIHASVTANANAEYFVCIDDPSTQWLDVCSLTSMGGTASVQYQAPAGVNYRVQITSNSGIGAYLMSASKT